jgi:hypothetical protein
MGRELRKRLLAAVCGAALLVSGAFSEQSLAAELHAFDPLLSLTGSCSVSTIDPVPDPGPCPGTTGIDHPAASFSNPKAVTTDSYGNIFVASAGPESALGTQGRIAIFDSSGGFITEILDESGPNTLAVDSEGNLYVANSFSDTNEGLVRYEPTVYAPATGQIEYGDPPVVLAEVEASGNGLAINPANDHLFRKRNDRIIEYGSAAEVLPGEPNAELGTIAEGQLQSGGPGLAIDEARGRIYAATWEGPPQATVKLVKVFDLAPPHGLLFKIEESDVPEGHIATNFMSVAVDEGTGHSFLYAGSAKQVYEFDESGSYLSTIEHSFQYTFLSQITVDNGENSPNGALNPAGRYLFVPSHPGGTGHAFAFGPSLEGAPKVESVSFGNVGENEAELRASIEPFGLDTEYTFEYLTRQQYDEAGEVFTNGQVAGKGLIPAGNSPIDVAAAANGLDPGTTYRFRVIATNEEGEDEAEGELTTYPASPPFQLCPNDPLRTGLSALLPDCRAYELVTPPDTNARAPRGVGLLGLVYFATREASPQGEAVTFQIEGGTIPGYEGAGSLAGDPYLSKRGGSGWTTAIAGPSGAEAPTLLPGSTSPDQGYSFWKTGDAGTAAVGGSETMYVRYPDGHSALVGRGTIGGAVVTDPRANGVLISENGGHIIFFSGGNNPAIQLEDQAPPDGTRAIYDRTSDEITHVVSLLPEDETPQPGEHASYEGASLDGRGVAFEIGNTLYLRHDNDETFEIGDGVAFAGVAMGGGRIFYVEGGDLLRFDVETEAITPFSTTGDVTPVNISADGSTAFFISPTAVGGEVNPNGADPLAGGENLYRSHEGSISFVGTVTAHDVEGELGNEPYGGLGLWLSSVGVGKLGAEPSRTTPNGDVLLFESRAPLDGYDPEDHTQIYRYDFAADDLNCLSCNPTNVPATSDASLQSVAQGLGDPEPFSAFGYVANLSSDGRRAFFQSTEALVPGDNDDLQDVYEWEVAGSGSCTTLGGCVYLISSGHSLRTAYLYAASDTGGDVFFRSSDVLLPRDAEETPSIYDARIGGGFPEPTEGACQGEGCRPGVTPAPTLAVPAAPTLGAEDNLPKRCPKGKRKVRRKGKVLCVKKKAKHRQHRHTATKKKEVAR